MISGFTLVRNGEKFEYPYLESLRSLLPLVDELVVNVGIGEDSTLEWVRKISEKETRIRYFESDWCLDNPEKKRGGLILSEQTNLALDQCRGDWCMYLQADEVLHEEDVERLRSAILGTQNEPAIEGLVFDYIHFYGSFDVVQQTRSSYRREVRAIRKSSGARSVGDAQSFRKGDGSKLQVVHSGARVFHYGWVRTPEAMREKTFFFDQLYHGDPSPENAEKKIPHTGNNYQYKRFWGLRKFQGTHPKVMLERIARKGWHWDLENSPLIWNWGDLRKIALDLFERVTGYRPFEYRSYKQIGK